MSQVTLKRIVLDLDRFEIEMLKQALRMWVNAGVGDYRQLLSDQVVRACNEAEVVRDDRGIPHSK